MGSSSASLPGSDRRPSGGKAKGGAVVEFPSRRRSDPPAAVAPRPLDPLRPTVFHEEWWLGAATGGEWQEVTVERDGKTIGRFPYVITRTHAGSKLCTMPALTHFLGPAADPGPGSVAGEPTRTSKVVADLIRKMPRTPASYHKVHAGMTDMVPFQEEGYDVGVQYTYEIAPAPEADIWKGMRDKTRNAIRGSKARVMIDGSVDPVEFVEFMGRNLVGKGLVNANPDDKVLAVCRAALDRGRGRLSGTRAPSGKLTSAVFCPSDSLRSHYLLSSRSADAGSGDVSLLVWDAIRVASMNGLVFDFDGIGTAGSVNFFEGFGGVVMPRYIATRYSRAQKALMMLRTRGGPGGPRFY